MITTGWAVPHRPFLVGESDGAKESRRQYDAGQLDALVNARGIWASPIVPPIVDPFIVEREIRQLERSQPAAQ